MNCPGCNTTLAADAQFCGSCGRSLGGQTAAAAQVAVAASDDSTTDMVGRDIAGRYRIRAMLGAGGMGAVFRAEQISLKRTVALKLLKQELCDEPGIVRRFNAEAELAAKLNHPNTVTLFDFGQDDDGTLFIAMEYVQGESLRSVLRSGPLPVERTLRICEQVAASLADAHTFGIIHRDLKPDNVMLSERGKQADFVTVLDFGIAKLRDRDTGEVAPVTQAGDLLGTPQYMAPEQVRGDTVDGRTDVYAMGVMMYEMLTGRVPFTGSTVMQILSQHLTDSPPPLAATNPRVAVEPALETLVLDAMHKDPGARPASMEQMGERIAALATPIGHAATVASPGTAPTLAAAATPPASATLTPAPSATPMPAPAGKPPIGWIIGGVVALAVVTAGIVFAIQGGDDGSAQSGEIATKGPNKRDTWYDSPNGYKLEVPPGYVVQGEAGGYLRVAGTHNGAQAGIIVGVVNGGAAWTKPALLKAAQRISLNGGGGTSLHTEWQKVQGTAHLVGTYATAMGQRFAFVLFPKGTRLYLLMYGTADRVFASAGPLMTELAEKRFVLK